MNRELFNQMINQIGEIKSKYKWSREHDDPSDLRFIKNRTVRCPDCFEFTYLLSHRVDLKGYWIKKCQDCGKKELVKSPL